MLDNYVRLRIEHLLLTLSTDTVVLANLPCARLCFFRRVRSVCCHCGGACIVCWTKTNARRADGYVMPKILPDFDSCDRGARCPGALEKLERREDDTEGIIRERCSENHRR